MPTTLIADNEGKRVLRSRQFQHAKPVTQSETQSLQITTAVLSRGPAQSSFDKDKNL